MIIIPIFFLVIQIFGAEAKDSLESQIARKYLDVVKDSINNRKENAFLNGLAEDVNVHTCHENLVYKDFTKVRVHNTTSIIYDDKLTKAYLENDNNEIAANYLSVRIGSDGQVLVRKNLVKLRLDNNLPQFKAKFVRNDCSLPAHELLAKIYKDGKVQSKTTVSSTTPTTPVSEYWNLRKSASTKSVPYEIEESEFKNLKSPKSKL